MPKEEKRVHIAATHTRTQFVSMVERRNDGVTNKRLYICLSQFA